MDALTRLIGTTVTDEQGEVWTVQDIDFRRTYDPTIMVWNRQTAQTRYIGLDRYDELVQITEN